MVYIMYDATKIKDCRYCSEESVASIDNAIVIHMHNKTRAMLVREAVDACKTFGLTECYVKNINTDRYHHIRYESQSWYVFKDDLKWFYKQSKNTKARHEITEAA